MIYKVKKSEPDRLWYIMGLPSETFDGDEKNTVLLCRLPCGDLDNPSSKEKMFSALYDELQCNDAIKDGDSFETPFGIFQAQGIHVVEIFD
jgi:hypothetical protein